MFENLNNIAGFNMSAILFASIFGLICFFIAKYILAPVMGPIFNFFEFIYDNVLEPIINIFNNKNKQTSTENTAKNSAEKGLLERTFVLALDWFSKGLIIKLIIIIITFITLNYLLICLEEQKSFLSFNLKSILDAFAIMISTGIVSSGFSLLTVAFGIDFRRSIGLSLLIFSGIGLVHYFF
jgi:hypothetical protein